MNVLFVTYHYLNGVGGGVYASRANINAFAVLSDDITLLCPVKENCYPQCVDKKVNIIGVTDTRNIVSKAVDYYLKGIIHRYYDIFEKTLINSNADTVVFDTSCCSFKLIDIAHKYNKKVITIHHNYQYEYAKDNMKGLLSPIYLRWIKKIESEAVHKSDLNLVLTNDDKRQLADNYINGRQSKIFVLGAFEYEYKNYDVLPKKIKNVFVITGDLSTVQMCKSLYHWLNEYYPILKKEKPNAKLIIAGKNPEQHLLDFCSKEKIELIASPQTMKPILERANYYICPVSLGGGIKLRIMDGLKNGLQILTHEVSSRGYEDFYDLCVYSYCDASSFKEQLHDMVTSTIFPDEIVKRYKQYFTFEAGIKRLNNILKNNL